MVALCSCPPDFTQQVDFDDISLPVDLCFKPIHDRLIDGADRSEIRVKLYHSRLPIV